MLNSGNRNYIAGQASILAVGRHLSKHYCILFEILAGQAYKDPFQRYVSVGHDSYIVGSALGGAINICPNGPQLRSLNT